MLTREPLRFVLHTDAMKWATHNDHRKCQSCSVVHSLKMVDVFLPPFKPFVSVNELSFAHRHTFLRVWSLEKGTRGNWRRSRDLKGALQCTTSATCTHARAHTHTHTRTQARTGSPCLPAWDQWGEAKNKRFTNHTHCRDGSSTGGSLPAQEQ